MSIQISEAISLPQTFENMALPKAIIESLNQNNFTKPTPIQEQAIPVALEGRDILGSAQTGTGKTAAFAIPLIVYLMKNQDSAALIMTPTRELATQVMNQIKLIMCKNHVMKTALLIGGEPYENQLRQLKKKPNIVVGTPGRIYDHIKRKTLKLKETRFLVLDETDRMLDMGFSEQIDDIVKYMPESRQTLLFSATLPKNILKITDNYLTDPVHIKVNPTSNVADNITQNNLFVKESEKLDTLKTELENRNGSVIIFTKTKIGADKLATRLNEAGFDSKAIHGDLRQNKRSRIIIAFRKNKFNILVATDVAARGLDIPHIEHVINYDLPQCPEDYIHRIGRTARAGAAGEALNIISPADKVKWFAIERMLNPELKKQQNKDQNGSGRGQRKPRRNFGNNNKKPFWQKNKKNSNRPTNKPNRKKA